MADPADYHYKPADGLRHAVIVLLGLSLAVLAVRAVLSLREMWLIAEFAALFDPTEADAADLILNETLTAFAGIAQVALLLITVIPFLMLVHRLTANAWSFQAGGKKPDYSPGWAVGYFFIPILNLVRPAQVMNQNFDLSETKNGRVPATPNLWWCGWVFAGIAGRAYTAMTNAAGRSGDLDLFWYAEIVSLLNCALGAASAAAAILMFRDLAARQAVMAASPAARSAAPACESCGEPLRTDDARCGVCGAARPAFAAAPA
ncbi:DUF4328 domain-containing protein [Alienimonas californiensis]|uniref:DUF4328 domain-containing protein n=1 Tax=Alienimonas californiensis TaxID=2527989 RepID=A0A517PF46_9PLAN|nr:DUF4328 domain-containing protein [Alienimonas californiensis]QDT18001.1 hypothetical protein CA12_41390 [Alienimonas californiensis]